MKFFLCALSVILTLLSVVSAYKIPISAPSEINSTNIDEVWSSLNPLYNTSSPNGGVRGVLGVDVSSWIGQDTWSCLLGQGYSVAVVRNYQSNCQVDPNGVHTVANALAAGLQHVDIYLFPSFGCGYSAAQQVDQAIDSMGGIQFGTLWFDIETQGSGWSGDVNANHDWLRAGVNEALNRLGAGRVGIYSSEYAWSVVMGGYSDFSNLPLWYAHYDENPSFSDFSPFAGWSAPAMKQFQGDASVCGADVDLNWYP